MSTLLSSKLNYSVFSVEPKDAGGTSKMKTKLGKLLHLNVDS